MRLIKRTVYWLALVVGGLSLSTNTVFAQSMANYAVAPSAGTFTPLTGIFSTPARSAGSLDNGSYNNLPIGFSFRYMGVEYTTLSAATNGFVVLGNTVPSGDSYTRSNQLRTNALRQVLAPLWDDIALSAEGTITYQLSGVPGSRIFTIQYLNIKWRYNTSGVHLSFQVKLYEETGEIVFVYRSESGNPNNNTASVGINSTGTGSGTFVSLSALSASPTIERGASHTANISAKPTTGQTYTFTPASATAPTNLTFTSVTGTTMTLNWDDNASNEMGYAIYRSSDGGLTYSLATTTGQNIETYNATGLSANTAYTWKVVVLRESFGNAVSGTQATANDANPLSHYSYPFNSNANDASGNGNNGNILGATLVADRYGNANSAYSFDGVDDYMSTTTQLPSPGPNNFTVSLWFKTNTANGGKLVGFGGSQTGQSGNYDRHLYMSNDGKLNFGVYTGVTQVIQSPLSYNDNQWHNAVMMMNGEGMKLYIDGILIGTNPTTIGESFAGYWRLGYDNLTGWPDIPSNGYFAGIIDDVNIYGYSLSPESIATQATFLNGYAYKKEIVLNTGDIAAGALTNFPYLIDITDADLKHNALVCDVDGGITTIGKVISATGADIAFTSNTGTPLSYEIEKYEPATGRLVAWIKLPAISNSGDLSINMIFGKANPDANVSSNVWTDYSTVFHFNEEVYTGTTTDATSSAIAATSSGMNAANLVSGFIGNAYSYNGSSQKFTSDLNSVYAHTSGAFTLSAWVRTASAPTDQKIISNQTAGGVGYKMGIYNSRPEIQNNGNPARDGQSNMSGTSAVVSNGQWYHVQGVFTGNSLVMYVNGVQRQTRTGMSSPSAGTNLHIGVGEGANQYWFNGLIDEVRTSAGAKNATWALTEYRNQSNPTITGGTSASVVSIGPLQADATQASTYPGLVYTYTGPPNGNMSVASYFTNNTSNLQSLPPKSGKFSLIIPASATPQLTEDFSVYGLSLGAGATLNLNGNSIKVACNVYNSGVISGTSGSFLFNGTGSIQEYNGNATASVVGTLNLSNTSGGTINLNSGKIEVGSLLSLNNNSKLVIDASATLTLKSTASGFANVGPINGSSSITGAPEVEMFFTGGVGKRGTRLVSPPINDLLLPDGSKFYQQLKTSMVITGPGAQTNGFDRGNDARPEAVTLTKYNETFVHTVSPFEAVPNLNSTTLAQPGQGFGLFYRGNRAGYNVANPNLSTKLYDDYVPESFSPVFKGVLNTGNVQVPISFTNNPGDAYNGYNIVGNPYQATIDWEAVYADNASLVQNEIRIIQPGGVMMTRTKVGSNPPVVVNAIGDAGNAQYIQPGQGFYIRKSSVGTANLNFNEAHKQITSTPNRLLSTPNLQIPQDKLSMRLGNNIMNGTQDHAAMVLYLRINGSTSSDETAIVFNDDFNENVDPYDVAYILGTGNSVLLYSSSADGLRNNAINFMPGLSSGREIKLTAVSTVTDNVNLEFRNPNVLGRFKVKLRDNLAGTLTDIKLNPIYPLHIDRTNPATYINRFALVFEEGPQLALNLSSFTGQKMQNHIALDWQTASEESSVRFDIERSADGISFMKIGAVDGAGTTIIPNSYNFIDSLPLSGMNIYRLKQIYGDGTSSLSSPQNVLFRHMHLASMTVKKIEEKVKVFWTTEKEEALIRFEIERSVDGLVFDKIGELAASGSPSAAYNYSFEDANAVLGLSYYRLKFIFADVTPSTSKNVKYNNNLSLTNNFTVTQRDESLVLDWTASISAGHHFFEIQHSADGADFKAIASLALPNGDGSLKEFSFIHNEPAQGINRYRIKHLYKDGDHGFSDVVAFLFRKGAFQQLSASRKNNLIDLQWKIIDQINTVRFEIEKSVNGEDFTKIGEVAAAGTLVGTANYQFSDNDPLSGKNYYRLKLIFSDAQPSYSQGIETVYRPFNLAQFELENNGRTIALSWATISEDSLLRFEIERSANGVNFDKIDEAIAVGSVTAGAGYSFVDGNPLIGQSFYRIKGVFRDAEDAYSSLKAAVVRKLTVNELLIKALDAGLEISWNTQTEERTRKFEIERSDDGITFSKIGELAGAGNTSISKQYTFNDVAPISGLGFYRIKQVFDDAPSLLSEHKSIIYRKLSIEHFTGMRQGDNVLISWITTGEQSTTGFEIERSSDGINFSKIGTQTASGGNANRNYLFSDTAPLNGINYYRLKQIFNDTEAAKSAVKTVAFRTISVQNLSVSATGKGIAIGWGTSSEVQTMKFEVERSSDGISFVSIGTQASTGSGSGTNYTFSDAAPMIGMNYYRIKQFFADADPLNSEWKSITHRINGVQNLTLSRQTSSILVNWKTSSEQNTARFEIERSQDGVSYVKIGEQTGAGNSASLLNYTFTDITPLSGTAYYRVIQIFTDAAASSSTAKSIVFRNFVLGSFTVTKKDNSLQITWTTQREENSVSYDIERSSDGVNFAQIGMRTGAGNSSNPRIYDFTDAFPIEGKTYYRLKQNFSDASSVYSNIIEAFYKAPLELSLGAFSVVRMDDAMVLNWNTLKEVKGHKFEIERSVDAVNFSKIGDIAASGNSVTTKAYHFVDKDPVTGNSYYRLKFIDEDGDYTYSSTRIVNYPAFTPNGIGNLIVFPNPAVDKIEVKIKDVNAIVTVYDLSGRIRHRVNFKRGEKIVVEVADLSSGLYFMELRDPANNVLLGSAKFYKR